MKNVKIELRFGSKEGIKTAKFDLKTSDSFRVLRKVANTKIEELSNTEIVFVNIQPDGTRIIAEDTNLLGSLSQETKLEFICIPRYVNIVVKTASGPKPVKLDVTNTILSLICELVEEPPGLFALAFVTSEQNIIVCSQVLPLCVQGWFHEPLYLFRRLVPQDTTLAVDKAQLLSLLRNARWAASIGLSLYSIDNWASLAALHLFIESDQTITQAYIRENYMRFLPPIFKNSDSMVKKVTLYLRSYAKMTQDAAISEYLQKAATLGCQCAFIQNVKFKTPDQSWFFSKDVTLFVSYIRIGLTKDRGMSLLQERLTNSILKVVRDKDVIMLMFKDDSRWQLKSPFPDVLSNAIEEMRQLPQLSRPKIEETHEDVLDLPQTPVNQQQNLKATTAFHTQSNLASTFDLDLESDFEESPVRANTLSSGGPSLRKMKVLSFGNGMSSVTAPMTIDAESEILLRDLKIHVVKRLDFDQKEENVPVLPDHDQFFGLTPGDTPTNWAFVFVLFILIYYLLKFLLKHRK